MISVNLLSKHHNPTPRPSLLSAGRAFEGFSEGDISFLPTYKYDPGTNTFDTSHKQRIPAYTDRVLFKSRRDNVR